MASLGELISKRLARSLRDRGFEKNAGRGRLSLYTRPDVEPRHIAFDRVRGFDVRLILAVGRIPGTVEDYPVGIEAESPWWEAAEAAELPAALHQAWAYLERCGFSWLEDPLALTPTQWRVQHNLLVRDFRLAAAVVTWPGTMSLNDRVLRLRRCVPDLGARTALEVRSDLLGRESFVMDRIPLASALEQKLNAEAEGFSVEIRNL